MCPGESGEPSRNPIPFFPGPLQALWLACLCGYLTHLTEVRPQETLADGEIPTVLPSMKWAAQSIRQPQAQPPTPRSAASPSGLAAAWRCPGQDAPLHAVLPAPANTLCSEKEPPCKLNVLSCSLKTCVCGVKRALSPQGPSEEGCLFRRCTF